MLRLLACCPIAISFLLGGCASAWERAFEPSFEARGQTFAGTEEVVLREVPWERVDAVLRELHEEAVASDTHPDDWPEDRKRDAHARLLRALQISDDPDTLLLLGRSEFSTTEPLRPGDGDLEAFATKIGATYAIWASNYLGRSERIVSRPVTTWSTETYWVYDRKNERYRPRTGTSSSTTYLPMRVEADRHAFIVFFLRPVGGGAPEPLDAPAPSDP
jgi:hypothetical protein